MTFYDDVSEFHYKFGLPNDHLQAKHCCPMTHAEEEERLGFIHEELTELEGAFDHGTLAEQVDALVDLVWVVLGTAHYLHAPFNEAWAEVKRANMEKVKAPVDPKKPYRKLGAVVKPEGWKPPDIEHVIEEHNDR